MKRLAILILIAATLTACSTSSTTGTGTTTSATTTSATTTSSTPTPTKTTDPNAAVCVDVNNYVVEHVKVTLDHWDVNNNEFDAKTSTDLRDEATHLFSLASQATDQTAEAITNEARGLTNISIAMGEQDDQAVGDAANAANSSLAELRGKCGF